MSPAAPLLSTFLTSCALPFRIGVLSGLAALAFGSLLYMLAAPVLRAVTPDLPPSSIQSLQHILAAGIVAPAILSGLAGFVLTRRLTRRPVVACSLQSPPSDQPSPPPACPFASPPINDLYKQLNENAQRYRSLFDFNPSAVFTLDPHGRFTEVNPACEKLSGYWCRELLTMTFTQLVAPELRPAAMAAFRRGLGSEVQSGDTVVCRKDGSRVDLQFVGGPIIIDHHVVGCFVIATDITHRKAAAETLERTKAAAESANRAKDRFLAVLSHELRTPLTPVVATLDFLAAHPQFPPQLRPDVDLIRRNVQLEAHLIDDLLDLTRIAREKICLNLQPVNLHALLSDTLVICQQDLTAKSLRVVTEFQATDATIQGDSARLSQVLWNLLKNAIKFTPIGGTITLRTRPAEGPNCLHKSPPPPSPEMAIPGPTPPSTLGSRNQDTTPTTPQTWICLDVIDTGIGIDPAILPRIFNAFEQGEATVTREFGGLGLGLTISKALIDMHDGTITAASLGRGQGATFSIHLPTIPQPAAQPDATPPQAANRAVDGDRAVDGNPRPPQSQAIISPTPSPTAPTANAPSLHILVVEDHLDTANAIARLLRIIGHRVTTADSVQSALDAAAAHAFDLVISDIGLPDGTGNDLMQQLKNRYHLPGIALSGYGMQDDVKRALDAGFFAHLTKPIEFPELQSLLHRGPHG